MRRKAFLLLFAVLVLIGCKPQKYDIIINAVDVQGQTIPGVKLTIEGQTVEGQGILAVSLKAGNYMVHALDDSGIYEARSMMIKVFKNEEFRIHLSRNTKAVQISALMADGQVLERARVSVDGFEAEENTFFLQMGETYTAAAEDPLGYFQRTEKTFVVGDTDSLAITMPEAPKGTVAGTMNLKYQERVIPIVYAYAEFGNEKILIENSTFSLSVPEGHREIRFRTVFGSEFVRTVQIKGGETMELDVEYTLPKNFPIEKWTIGTGNVPMISKRENILGRWAKKTLTYCVSFTDRVRTSYSESSLNVFREVVRNSTAYVEQFMEGMVEYEEVTDLALADVEITLCWEGEEEIGNAKGLAGNDFDENGKIIRSFIYMNRLHSFNMITSPIIVSHELGHTLAVSHSPDPDDLMYYNPAVFMDQWVSAFNDEKMIFGLLYSMPHPTVNPFVVP